MSGSPAKPLLSLCLATYNRARYLDRYLTHHLDAFEQEGLDYELVVSDNASTDETPQILARYAARYPRMRVSRQARNVGAYPNILTTLHQARGEVVVSIADDDLAITGQLINYARRFADDPDLVMLQAPWLLTDETRDGAVIGKFYDFEGDHRFTRGQYGNCLAFVLEHQAFPECWLMRRSAVPSIAGPLPRFTYSFFNMLAQALGKGDVMFCPEPHLKATAITKGVSTQVGNREAMESWDLYRGGLELMTSYARQFNPGALPGPAVVGQVIDAFVFDRIAVAARLHAHARNWSNAYQLLRRLHGYELTPDIGVAPGDVALLAAVETALVECAQLGATQIVCGDSLPDHVLERMNDIEGTTFIRAGDVSQDDTRRAYCGVGVSDDPTQRPCDFTCDIVVVMERFPALPAT